MADGVENDVRDIRVGQGFDFANLAVRAHVVRCLQHLQVLRISAAG
jgi:hypothetical protein